MMPLISSPKDRVAAETQAFVTLGQVLGGGFILTGLYFTAKSYALARRGQFAERLAAAIEGLADKDNLKRRVGSLLSLGAMTSGADSRDIRAIDELLCTFVRTETASDSYQDEHQEKPREDVQTALNILARRGRRASLTSWAVLDLRGSFLCGADLSHGDLRRTRLTGAELRSCLFFRTRPSGADLARTNLNNSEFLQADLRQTSFFSAVGERCTFRRAWLKNANLTQSKLRQSSFDEARIINSTFGQADLDGSTFVGAVVRGGIYHMVPDEILQKWASELEPLAAHADRDARGCTGAGPHAAGIAGRGGSLPGLGAGHRAVAWAPCVTVLACPPAVARRPTVLN
jgi:uncharacterized protein YjbI with pentapeptide repeats